MAAWGLGKNDRLLRPSSQSDSNDEDGAVLSKTYQGDHTQGAFLGIVIAEPAKTATYDFAFQDVKLP